MNGADYYWIGGTGNWTDLTHWATTSGGSIFHNQIPTANDDVYFDANSFSTPGQVVTLDALTCFVRDMSWTGVTNNPVLMGFSTLKIYGSLTLVNGMTQNFSGPINFEATTGGKTISTAGRSFSGNITFIGVGGGWTLLDNFTTSSRIYLSNGILNTNNQTVSASQFFSSGGPRTLNMGSSVFNLSSSGTSFPFWAVTSTNFIMNCGTSTINSTGNNTGAKTSFEGGNQTYYNLNFNGDANLGGIIGGSNTFQNVSFIGNGSITGSNTYANLNLAPGGSYVLTNGTVQTVNGTLFANGNCNALIEINSSKYGTQTTLSRPPGTTNLSFVILKDIAATGGSSFIVNNGVDLGNNSGWTINQLGSRDLYWIGGSGNWNDGNHWALSSNGPPSGCSPTPLDNVHFDNNSFSSASQSALINSSRATCKDMNWTGVLNNPTLAGPNTSILKIYGSLTFVADMNLGYSGLVSFESTSLGNLIKSAGKTFTDTVYFNGVGGEWTLQDAFNSTFPFYLNYGILNTNNQTINAHAFKSKSGAQRTLNMGSSVFNLSFALNNFNNLFGFWDVTSLGFTLNPGSSTINSTGNIPLQSPMFNGSGMTYHNLNFLGQNVRTADIQGSNNFHDVSFAGNGNIYSSNTFNNLTFSPSYVYGLIAGGVQTINGTLFASGNCNGIITISSLTSGIQTTFSHPPGSVTISDVSLKDTKAIGGATFTANNAVDLGNNTGWIINSQTGRNLFWIGNSGNWNDGNHWSLTSGGSPVGCPPSALDNVFFDANSFSLPGQSMTINVSLASCKDMTWTGATNNPSFSGSNTSQLKIYGSLVLISGMTLNFSGIVSFEATTLGKTITCGGKSFNNHVYFIGIGGSWTLLDSFSTFGYLYLNNGILTTNDQVVNASAFVSKTVSSRTLNMGSSVFNLSLPAGNSTARGFWDVSISSGLTLNSGTSTINSTGIGSTFFNEFWGGGLDYYDLNFLGTGSSGGNINFSNRFHNVFFSSNGAIFSNNIFNKLTFSAGNTYTLTSFRNQTVLDQFKIQGSCVSYIYLLSSIQGIPSTITKASGTVLGFNIHMRDIRAIGGATFFAYNSVDLGNNFGWTFTPLPPLANPEPIIGPVSLCEGASGISYYIPPVVGAISYLWVLPSGATILSGQGDTLITVRFNTAVVGNISVTAYSGCEFSLTRVFAVVVNSSSPPTISISANPGNSICSGSPVSFTAISTNGGVTPVYTWQVNGTNVGTNSSVFASSTISNGDIVTAIVNSSNTCASPSRDTSNAIVMTVNPILIPSVTATTGTTTICAGSSVSFTAAPTNGGTTPMYQWQLNGVDVAGATAATYSTNTLLNGDAIRVILTSNAICASPAKDTSNVITITVNPILTPSVTATAGATTICTGGMVSFTAAPTNGGTAPLYQWQLNGADIAGATAATYLTNSLTNGDVVRVILTSNAICVSPAKDTSNAITMTVNPILTPSVTATAGATTICAGSPVSFTASPTNGGTAPLYQWQLNGVDIAGATAATYSTNSLVNGDIVRVILSSNALCASPAKDTSNIITMTVNPILTPSVTATAGATTICAGSPVSFTATPTNGGTAPLYQWQLNGIDVAGATAATYSTNTLVNGDMVRVILTSNAICATPPKDTSNVITMVVNPILRPSVTVASGATTICAGSMVNFSAAPTNGGTAPLYQWQLNGVNVAGATAATYSTNTLLNGDMVRVILTSNALCASPSKDTSNVITMMVNPILTPSVVARTGATTICAGSLVSFTATPTNGGAAPLYQWQVNGVDVAGATAATYSTSTLVNGDVVRVILTSSETCLSINQVSSPILTINVIAVPIASVGITVAPVSICYRTMTTFTATPVNGGPNPRYQWTLNGLNVGSNNPVFSTSSLVDGDIISCLMKSNLICASAEYVSSNAIKVVINPSVCPEGFFMPTGFTPNKDGLNDLCKPVLLGNVINYQFSIYNRWGQKVFETTDIKKGWDGKVNGSVSNSNVFAWFCIFQFAGKEKVMRKGTLVLVR